MMHFFCVDLVSPDDLQSALLISDENAYEQFGIQQFLPTYSHLHLNMQVSAQKERIQRSSIGKEHEANPVRNCTKYPTKLFGRALEFTSALGFKEDGYDSE
jgi:hypothetical protein